MQYLSDCMKGGKVGHSSQQNISRLITEIVRDSVWSVIFCLSHFTSKECKWRKGTLVLGYQREDFGDQMEDLNETKALPPPFFKSIRLGNWILWNTNNLHRPHNTQGRSLLFLPLHSCGYFVIKVEYCRQRIPPSTAIMVGSSNKALPDTSTHQGGRAADRAAELSVYTAPLSGLSLWLPRAGVIPLQMIPMGMWGPENMKIKNIWWRIAEF